MSEDVSRLDDIPDVDIDSNGRFKYVLIEVNYMGSSKRVVRGYKWGDYHGR